MSTGCYLCHIRWQAVGMLGLIGVLQVCAYSQSALQRGTVTSQLTMTWPEASLASPPGCHPQSSALHCAGA